MTRAELLRQLRALGVLADSFWRMPGVRYRLPKYATVLEHGRLSSDETVFLHAAASGCGECRQARMSIR